MIVGAELSLEHFLIDAGALTPAALERARTALRQTRERGEADGAGLARVLANLGLVAQEDLARSLARHTGRARLSPGDFPEAPLDFPGLSIPFLKAHHVLPRGWGDGRLRAAMADPTDSQALEAMAFAACADVEAAVATFREIEEAIQRLYGTSGDGDAANGALASLDFATDDVIRLKELASDAPVIRLVDRAIEDAYAAGASDIHFEPQEEGLRLRARIDGILRDRPAPPPELAPAILSRLKIMAHLDIAERRLPQDGRIAVRVAGRPIDLRVSTTPTAHGESVVLRLLDKGTLPRDFAELGFAEDAIARLDEALARPEGIVLVTGPTGSGKTTTLYAALQQLNAPEKKILTVEDPIEYMLAGINQVQVAPKIGRTFAASLRSFLRQDPDILMVGEIRDRETAEVAVEAAMTGHLVLSTLHTNDAAGAIARLLDMGVEDFLIASTLTLVVGQRLVRTLCPACKRPTQLEDAMFARIPSLARHRGGTFQETVGCPECDGAGFSGRRAIAEMLPVTGAIRALIQRHASAQEIEAAAVAAGMRTMLEDGLARAAAGSTTIAEVLRVTRED